MCKSVVSPPPSERDEQRRRVEAAKAHLARHERLSRIALLLLTLVSIILLAMLANHLWAIRTH
jgi:hypothetical protein